MPLFGPNAGEWIDLGALRRNQPRGWQEPLNDIANTGLVASHSTAPGGQAHAVAWTEKTGMVDLGTLADTGDPKYRSHNSSDAYGTNKRGTLIVGGSGVAGNPEVGFQAPVVWTPSKVWTNGEFVTKWKMQDAQLLLQLMMEDRFPRIWVADAENRDLRQLLWHRHRLVQMRTRVMNQLHVVALNEGLQRKKALGRPAGRTQLESLVLAPWASRRRQDLLGLVDQLTPKIAELTRALEDEVEKRAVTRRLMTHPGVGPLTALAFELVIGTPDRFYCGKQIASYVGLVPEEKSSGNRRRLGHISKQGNGRLRFLLVEAAQVTVRSQPRWRSRFFHLAMRRGRKIAKVAMARKLAVHLYWMWRAGTTANGKSSVRRCSILVHRVYQVEDRMRLGYFCIAFSVSACLFPLQAMSQVSGMKVCVAVVNNHTAELLSPGRMTARLVKAVSDKKHSAVAMETATGDSRKLQPTLENSEEMKSKDCDYIVLTMVTGSSRYATPDDAGISIGHARVPSIDASDPLGGESGPVYRNELEINFAVFRAGNPHPIVDTQILDRARASASDSLMDAMDREGNRVRHELRKK